MKKLFLTVLVSVLCTVSVFSQIKIGNRTINTKRVLSAAKDVVSAIALSDEDVAVLCRESVAWMDGQNPVSSSDSKYFQRLNRLMSRVKKIKGLKLNYKVYEVDEINAFACGDGSIRVFSALMDLMTDDELMAVIGHEIGHVVNTDSKDAMKNAYLTSAVRAVAGSAGGVLEKLTDSELGKLTEAFTTARFSQKQEYAADAYAFDFCLRNGLNPYGMANALDKLNGLAGGVHASKLQQMFSSHPDSAKRALLMREKADAYMKK